MTDHRLGATALAVALKCPDSLIDVVVDAFMVYGSGLTSADAVESMRRIIAEQIIDDVPALSAWRDETQVMG